MLATGVYPASVTPFDARGRPDRTAFAGLLAWFEASGCKGAVIAGTNGEGPSLSAAEKRDLIYDLMPLKGSLDLILGIATPSIDEAKWLCRHAGEAGAVAALVMPPGYYRAASEGAIVQWFAEVMDASPVPVIAYNFPKATGITLSPEMLGALSKYGAFAGAKDSSCARENLDPFAGVVAGKSLYVGDETLVLDALRSGWSGTISGAANVLAPWLSQIVREFESGDVESAETKFELVRPCIELIRASMQPATSKAILVEMGILSSPTMRLPLEAVGPQEAQEKLKLIEARVGRLVDAVRPSA